MNPLQIFVESSKKLTPSLIEYEVGTEVEMIVYRYLEDVRSYYDDVLMVSFVDAHVAFLEYLKRVLRRDVLRDVEVISLLSKKFKDSESAPLIAGRLGSIIEGKRGKILAVFLGLDFYSIVFSEKSLLELFPRIVNLTRYNRNLNIVSVFNGAIFSSSVSQMLYTFSLNVMKLSIERTDGDFKRVLTIIRSAFPEYNLRRWHYDVIGDNINFMFDRSSNSNHFKLHP
ncbi:MAG: hypothetical protein DRP01_08705 [Archaeoglobales archaeon]|nr:MAG: hypothetical protein DRP01_08705 [Archaeoglobales archaeon]